MESKFPTRRTILAGAALSVAAARAQQTAGPRMGVIGLGNRAQRHLAAYEELGGVTVSALCDIQAGRARAARKGAAANAAIYVDYRELLADASVDAVTIAAPNFLHAEMAIAAMKAGKDVLMEKPLGLTYAQAKSVLEASERYGRVVAVGMQRHYFPPYQAITRFVREGGLGPVHLYALNEYRGDWNPRTWRWPDPETGETVPWRRRRELAGSSLLEFSVHSYGFLYEMIGAPLAKCSATGGAVHWPERTTEDAISVIADYASGARVQHTYCGFAPGAKWQLTIVGDRGSLQYDQRSATVRRGGEEPFELDLGPKEGPSNEASLYEEFFRNVRERSPSPLRPAFALEAAKLAYGAWMSIDGDRIIRAADFA